MESVKETIKGKLGRFGIESSTKERCTVCDYKFAMRVTITYTNGETTSHCKYCTDKELVKSLPIATTEEEKRLKTIQAKAKYFNRIPNDLKNVTIRDYQRNTEAQKQARELAAKYIVDFDGTRSLVFSGNPGIGKSHLAVGITKALSSDYSTLFLKTSDILALMRESYDNGKHSEKDVFDISKRVDLLVIDDLGAEYDRNENNESWASNIMFRILDSRLGKSTIVTTNYSESELEKKYGMDGKRIVSRMCDNADKLRIDGKDMRKIERD